MKKFLLVSAMITCSLTGMAQALTATPQKTSVVQLKPLDKQQQIATSAKQNNTRRTYGTGVYYTRPTGSLYQGWDKWTGLGYYFTRVAVPPFTDVTFEDQSAYAADWFITSESAGGLVDASDNVKDGNYIGNYYSGYGNSLYYAPTLQTSNDSYTLGEINVYVKREYTETLGLMTTDSISTLYLTDPLAATEYEGQWYGSSTGWGILDNDNLFGNGKWTNSEGTELTCLGAFQVFPKPVSPLFISTLFVDGVTNMNSQPIPDGKQLTALITKTKASTVTYSNGDEEEIRVADLDNVIATMYANPGDTLGFSPTATTTRNQITYMNGTVIYTVPGEKDLLGNVTPANIVVDEEFAVVLIGFDQEGIDFGVYGREFPDEEIDMIPNARMLLTADGGETMRTLTYQGNMTIDMALEGMFDKAWAPKQPGLFSQEDETLNYRVIRVPEDGGTDENPMNVTEGSTEDSNMGAVAVWTNTSWFDEDENENYQILDLPDWIETYYVDNSMFEDYGGLNFLVFKAEALPAGVTGRQATIQVVGLEVTMDGEVKYSTMSEPITILQGDAVYDGIQTTRVVPFSSNNATYNLAGQRVTKATKGMFVKNGKKYISK